MLDTRWLNAVKRSYFIINLVFILGFVTTKAYDIISNIDTTYYAVSFTGTEDTSHKDVLMAIHSVDACLIDKGSLLKDDAAVERYFLKTLSVEKTLNDDIVITPNKDLEACTSKAGKKKTLILTVAGDVGKKRAFHKNIAGWFHVG